ncbi:hypothetical protein GGH94_004809 [Coemansia aciculifera]|uniref:Mediator of RNA polymerase II transcription subunit 21 n=1 Tax=Coemansia aciculifera TaxID=417176 RepID=A0A9W8M1U8_9FUNG|nr:hypothetical protein GGH94_004809 [Coemansia aciculifera]
MEGPSAQAAGVHVDRVTQLQDSIDQQCKLLFSSLHYLHKKAGMVQIGSEIAVTNQNIGADQTDEFTVRSQEIANDICCQAKKIDTLIESLPGVSISEVEQEREFAALNEENESASRELAEATKMAHALLRDISATLRTIADNAGKKGNSGQLKSPSF